MIAQGHFRPTNDEIQKTLIEYKTIIINGQRKCFECGDEAQHYHHVVPHSLGGTNTVDLCEKCHGVVHSLGYGNHRALVIKGLERRRNAGLPLGRKTVLDYRMKLKIKKLASEKTSNHQIGVALGISRETVRTFLISSRNKEYV